MDEALERLQSRSCDASELVDQRQYTLAMETHHGDMAVKAQDRVVARRSSDASSYYMRAQAKTMAGDAAGFAAGLAKYPAPAPVAGGSHLRATNN